MNLQELLGRVQFGTQLAIVDSDTGDRIMWRILPWYANIEYLFDDLRLFPVTGITVNNNVLRIEINRRRSTNDHKGGAQ